MDKVLDKNDSNMNLTWEKKKLVDSHDVAVHIEGDLFFYHRYTNLGKHT